jgi:DNA-binding CsgD family transcriptional regulator
MDPVEVIRNRSLPGVLILDEYKKPLYLNPTAVDILNCFNGSSVNTFNRNAVSIPKEILNLHDELQMRIRYFQTKLTSAPEPMHSMLSSPNGHYSCRGFFLFNGSGLPDSRSRVMFLIEAFQPSRKLPLPAFQRRYNLTDRQMEIIQRLVGGQTNKAIADGLCVSEDTIKGHFKHIMRRLGVSTRTEILSLLFQMEH